MQLRVTGPHSIAEGVQGFDGAGKVVDGNGDDSIKGDVKLRTGRDVGVCYGGDTDRGFDDSIEDAWVEASEVPCLDDLAGSLCDTFIGGILREITRQACL